MPSLKVTAQITTKATFGQAADIVAAGTPATMAAINNTMNRISNDPTPVFSVYLKT